MPLELRFARLDAPKAPEQPGHFALCKRWPVGGDRLVAHTVDEHGHPLGADGGKHGLVELGPRRQTTEGRRVAERFH